MNGDKGFLEEDIPELGSERFVITKRKKSKEGGWWGSIPGRGHSKCLQPCGRRNVVYYRNQEQSEWLKHATR